MCATNPKISPWREQVIKEKERNERALKGDHPTNELTYKTKMGDTDVEANL